MQQQQFSARQQGEREPHFAAICRTSSSDRRPCACAYCSCASSCACHPCVCAPCGKTSRDAVRASCRPPLPAQSTRLHLLGQLLAPLRERVGHAGRQVVRPLPPAGRAERAGPCASDTRPTRSGLQCMQRSLHTITGFATACWRRKSSPDTGLSPRCSAAQSERSTERGLDRLC